MLGGRCTARAFLSRRRAARPGQTLVFPGPNQARLSFDWCRHVLYRTCLALRWSFEIFRIERADRGLVESMQLVFPRVGHLDSRPRKYRGIQGPGNAGSWPRFWDTLQRFPRFQPVLSGNMPAIWISRTSQNLDLTTKAKSRDEGFCEQ